MSGSADATVRLWNKHNGEALRVVYGHGMSVLSAEIGATWMVTGSMDTEVIVWKIAKKMRKKHVSSAVRKALTTEEAIMASHANVSIAADCQYRLKGHGAAVTCVRYGSLEVLSGDILVRSKPKFRAHQ
jgi:WD40 repeat protein